MAAASNEPSRRLPLPKLAAVYELSRFLPDSDASKFFCSICFRVTTSPATLLCQHVFCESCIRNWLLRNYVCPLCRNQAMRYDVRLASGPFLEKLWLLKIRCSFHVVGCPKILALTDVENHERTCLYQVKRCEWKQCKRPLVVENEEDEPSRKKICCDRTCMIQATIEAGQKRITSHDCWNVLEEQAKGEKYSSVHNYK